MHAAYERATVLRPGPESAVWMAPVGHERAHSSHATQRLKSILGNPKEGCTSNGRASVRTPVFRLFEMIRNIRS